MFREGDMGQSRGFGSIYPDGDEVGAGQDKLVVVEDTVTVFEVSMHEQNV